MEHIHFNFKFQEKYNDHTVILHYYISMYVYLKLVILTKALHSNIDCFR